MTTRKNKGRMSAKSFQKRLKYNNTKFTNNSGKWDSKKEYRRYLLLSDMEKKGEITDLRRQVKFVLIPSLYEIEEVQLKTKIKQKKVCVERECSYCADFTYQENGKYIVEDVKSEITRKNSEYIIKRKLMRHVHGLAIREV